MGAYREGHGRGPVAEAHEDGLVDELIRQFADPLAFYRELVQNSIDADAKSIAVTMGWDPDPADAAAEDPGGLLTVAVRDDGCGMGRGVLEDQLTVLFRSGKEGQANKIGKFGVGFVSVLAVKPELVAVRTSEGKGQQWTLHLRGDQTYELFEEEGGGTAGTTVTLLVQARRSALDEYVTGSERALVKWCRHVEVPIRFVATGTDGSVLRESRIDRPLGLDALLQVRVEEAGTIVVAGLPRDGEPYLAFFNRGLLLHETTQDVLGRVMVSVQDSRLEHTLSRDNVRRDGHHERAMSIARRAIDTHLTLHVRTVLGEIGRRQRIEPRIDALVVAALRAGLDLGERTEFIPLLEPREGRTVIAIRQLRRPRVFVGTERDALTQAVARAGGTIVDVSIGSDPSRYQAVLASLANQPLEHVAAEMTLAGPVEASGSDLALLSGVADLLAKIVRRPNGPHLVELQGAWALRMMVTGGSDAPPWALDEEEASADPLRPLMKPPMLLNAGHPVVVAARTMATHDPRLAAALLTRSILSRRGEITSDLDDEWFARAAEMVD